MNPLSSYPFITKLQKPGLSSGRWLWYAAGFVVIYWVMPERFRVWFLALVALGALTRPGVLDRLKKTLGG